jgi:hypothetical protein
MNNRLLDIHLIFLVLLGASVVKYSSDSSKAIRFLLRFKTNLIFDDICHNHELTNLDSICKNRNICYHLEHILLNI